MRCWRSSHCVVEPVRRRLYDPGVNIELNNREGLQLAPCMGADASKLNVVLLLSFDAITSKGNQLSVLTAVLS